MTAGVAVGPVGASSPVPPAGPRRPPGVLFGRPRKPRGTRYSVVPDVERITSSPSPTCGINVYTAHLPSFDSAGALIDFHLSQSACVRTFFWAEATAGTARTAATR